MRTPVAK